METVQYVKTLPDLLKALEDHPEPVFVRLCARTGDDFLLLDQIVAQVQERSSIPVASYKLGCTTSQTIKQELMIVGNPVLLLIYRGAVRGLFKGIVGPVRLEEALHRLSDSETASN